MKKIRILIADSTHDLKKHLHTTITRLGHECLSALTIEGALDIIRRRKPDMVLCGTQLKDYTALQLCREVRKDGKHSNIPLILVTRNPLLLRDQGELKGMIDDVLLMPVSAREMFETIRAHLCRDGERGDFLVPMKTTVTIRDGNLYRSLTTSCLGKEGLLTATRSPEILGKVLDMNLTLPGLSIPLVVRGEFLEADADRTADAGPGMRIRFTEMDEESAAILDIYIQNYVGGAISQSVDPAEELTSTALAFIEERMKGA